MSNKYIEIDRELAALLWPEAYEAIQHINAEREQWSRDNAAAFALMVEYGVELEMHAHGVLSGTHMPSYVRAPYDEHRDKETAARYTIVQIVIEKLRARSA